MSIESIDHDLCTGCGICVDSCPMDVIRMDGTIGKPVIKYPVDCMLCLYCERDCPENAIKVSPEKNWPLIIAWG